jgi:hypothetical protein
MSVSRRGQWFASVQKPGQPLQQGDDLFVVEHARRDEKRTRTTRRERRVGLELRFDVINDAATRIELDRITPARSCNVTAGDGIGQTSERSGRQGGFRSHGSSCSRRSELPFGGCFGKHYPNLGRPVNAA